jgi:hypothetical protein
MSNCEYFLTMQFLGEADPDLLDVSSLLYDLELSHDYGVILSEIEYQEYKFTRYFWYRNGRPIEKYHHIKVLRLNKKSPLELTLLISSIGALLILLKIIEKVSNWSLNREKLKCEVEKLKLETKKLALETKKLEQQVALKGTDEQDIIHVHEIFKSQKKDKSIEEKIILRLGASRLKLTKIEFGPHKKEERGHDKNGTI